MSTTAAQRGDRSTRSLRRQWIEIDRIDNAVVAAWKTGVQLPPSAAVFAALNDASITAAEVIADHGAEPIPLAVRMGLLHLHCSVTDLLASLRLYSALEQPLKGDLPPIHDQGASSLH
jgi:hypothetical protein